MMGNTYYAFDFIANKMTNNGEWTQNWISLFGIENESVSTTKRILAIISGAVLPVISLTFLHLLHRNFEKLWRSLALKPLMKW